MNKPKLLFKDGFWWVTGAGECERSVYREAVIFASKQNYKLYPRAKDKSMHQLAAAISQSQCSFMNRLEPIQRY